VADSGGVDDSRYVSLGDSGSKLSSSALALPPGRYEVEWYQKAEPNTPLSRKVRLQLSAWLPDYSKFMSPCYAQFASSANGIWEKKTALVKIKETYSIVRMYFTSGGGFGIDNVSVVKEPVDPNVSPSQTTVTPTPDACKVSWVTPNDPSISTIVVRFSVPGAIPLKPTDGYAFGSITAIPGATQELSYPLDWRLNWDNNGSQTGYAVFA
jgi:hypothetical protein